MSAGGSGGWPVGKTCAGVWLVLVLVYLVDPLYRHVQVPPAGNALPAVVQSQYQFFVR